MTTAGERVAELKTAVAGLDREDVQRTSLPLPDDWRRSALDHAVRAATDADRAAESEAARRSMRQETFVRYGRAMLRPTWAGLNWGVSSGPPADHAAIAAALDEAAVLAVTDDLLDDVDRDTLSWAPSILLGSAGHRSDSGSLATVLSAAPRTRLWVVAIALVIAGIVLADLVLGYGISGLALVGAVILLVIVLAQRDLAARRR